MDKSKRSAQYRMISSIYGNRIWAGKIYKYTYMARQDMQVKSRTEESDARERVVGNASSATGCIQSLSSIFLETLPGALLYRP